MFYGTLTGPGQHFLSTRLPFRHCDLLHTEGTRTLKPRDLTV